MVRSDWFHFVQKRKILKKSACESKTIKGSIHVFIQERDSVWPVTPCVPYLKVNERRSR